MAAFHQSSSIHLFIYSCLGYYTLNQGRDHRKTLFVATATHAASLLRCENGEAQVAHEVVPSLQKKM